MSNIKVKVCGVLNLEMVKQLLELELDFIGFIFYKKSPRYVSNQIVQDLLSLDFGNTRPVCVYVNPTRDYVLETSSYFDNPILQFHGEEPESFCDSFNLEYWKAIRVKSSSSFSEILSYQSAEAILLENHKDGLYGGTGEAFDWSLIKDHDHQIKKIILSGGINIKNVDNAKDTLPWCIDLNSGVESSVGKKDMKLIIDILKNIKNEH
ncbi:phosphoribosylanthranilate isomerase [Gammaproteobacteria bacterium]|jgi:phosphoribosylanthranilate isomerase|nr:phosphoribosylanthranilate isomerase [Gammaproteobacteria bacterium]MDA9143535.1 phosphoribosylanthranilate isomerase [Gammaproteobacteria bacterium]MDC0367919.1 phosphoribosylanthranilate isomerase [Gammaproteobacteria bacterium]